MVSAIKRLAISVVLLSMLLGLALAVATPVQRTVAYAKLQFAWAQNWPLSRGAYLPIRLAPTLAKLGVAGPELVEIAPGLRMELDPGDVIERRILSEGIWRSEIWGWVSSHLSNGGTLIDVGAHVGDVALRGAQVVGATGTVLAIEPHPVLAAKLRRNAVASGLDNVRVIGVACGARSGQVNFYEGPRINLGASSLSRQNVIEHEGVGDVEFVIDIVLLDDLVADAALDRVDVIKIDTQGAELDVLRGAEETIARFHPAIIVETYESRLQNMGASVAELETFLVARGYVKAAQGGTDAHWVVP